MLLSQNLITVRAFVNCILTAVNEAWQPSKRPKTWHHQHDCYPSTFTNFMVHTRCDNSLTVLTCLRSLSVPVIWCRGYLGSHDMLHDRSLRLMHWSLELRRHNWGVSGWRGTPVLYWLHWRHRIHWWWIHGWWIHWWIHWRIHWGCLIWNHFQGDMVWYDFSSENQIIIKDTVFLNYSY